MDENLVSAQKEASPSSRRVLELPQHEADASCILLVSRGEPCMEWMILLPSEDENLVSAQKEASPSSRRVLELKHRGNTKRKAKHPTFLHHQHLLPYSSDNSK